MMLKSNHPFLGHIESVITQVGDTRTWLMSLVHAAFSCRDEATRMMVYGWTSLGSTITLKSRCSTSWPLRSTLAATFNQIDFTVTGLIVVC